jgi:thioredoxin-dependent peroxiredoxin
MTMTLLAMVLGASSLKVGDRAPDFTLPDTEGAPVTLSEVLKSGPVILAFYPKAFTPGCTQQNQNFRDKFAAVQEKGAQVLGISVDDVATQRRFKAEYKLPYPLLSDEGGKVAAQYSGKMPVVGLAKRANVVVGQDGKVQALVEGSDAIDPNSAIGQCPLRKKGGAS